ncbi:MAG: hypothetical protein KIS63_00860 [Caldilineales bacterium]|nr:hypothetical protein [Caldilineales bacterium]
MTAARGRRVCRSPWLGLHCYGKLLNPPASLPEDHASPQQSHPTPAHHRPRRPASLNELTWLQFNARVLEEALDASHPLLERVKFHSIFCSNLDEFFAIGCQAQRTAWPAAPAAARPHVAGEQWQPSAASWSRCWPVRFRTGRTTSCPTCVHGIHVLHYRRLKGKQRQLLRGYFAKDLPGPDAAFDPGLPFPTSPT